MGPAHTEALTALKTEAHSFQELQSTSQAGPKSCPTNVQGSDVSLCTCSLALKHTHKATLKHCFNPSLPHASAQALAVPLSLYPMLGPLELPPTTF